MLRLYAAEIMPDQRRNHGSLTLVPATGIESAKTVPQPRHARNFDRGFPTVIFQFNAFLIDGASILSSFSPRLGRNTKIAPTFFLRSCYPTAFPAATPPSLKPDLHKRNARLP